MEVQIRSERYLRELDLIFIPVDTFFYPPPPTPRFSQLSWRGVEQRGNRILRGGLRGGG